MSAVVRRAAEELNNKLDSAGNVTNYVLSTARSLSAATVGTVMSVMGGSAGLIAAFSAGVSFPAFASTIILAGGTLFGASTGALVSRFVGPAARRRELEHHREQQELRLAHARQVLEIWGELPADPPQLLIDAIAREIEKSVQFPDTSIRAQLPPPDVKRDKA